MKKAIKLNIGTNDSDRKVECIGIGEAEYETEGKSFWINTHFIDSKYEDDYLTISFDVVELLRVIGESVIEPEEF